MAFWDDFSREWDNLWGNQRQTPVDTGYTSGEYSPQRFTGSMGGNAYAAQPDLNKYQSNQFDLGKTISDWVGSIKMPWDNQPTQQGLKPFWQGTAGAQSETLGQTDAINYPVSPTGAYKPGTTETGYKFPTPFMGDEGFGTPKYTFENAVAPSTRETQIKNLIEQGRDDVMLGTVQSLGKSGQPLPEVSEGRLNSIQDERYMSELWNLGYKIPKVLEGAMGDIQKINQLHGGLVTVDQNKLSQLDYKSLVNVLTDLNELTDNEWKEITDSGAKLILKTAYAGVDEKGNKRYTAKWDVQEPYKTEAEKKTEKEKTKAETKAERDKEEAEERTKYWSAEEVAERNRRRKESADWSEAQQMEGWNGFYKILGGLKMAPEMDEFFNNPTMFNELRRQWKATGGGQTWETWLAQYDFDKTWGQLSPSRRGERPAVFAPRMRSVS